MTARTVHSYTYVHILANIYLIIYTSEDAIKYS